MLTKCKSTNYYVVTLKEPATANPTPHSSEQQPSTSTSISEDVSISLDEELDPTTFHNLLVIIEMKDIEHVRQFYSSLLPGQLESR